MFGHVDPPPLPVQSFGWRLATAPEETLSDAEVRAMMEKERHSNGGGSGKWKEEDDIVVANERSLATLSSTELLNHQVRNRKAQYTELKPCRAFRSAGVLKHGRIKL